jgi:2-haloalkanoic acid dehalogenase type II
MDSMTIKAITFDVGDTLIHPCISRAEAFVSVTPRHGYPDITQEQVEHWVPGMNAFLAQLIDNDISFNADETRAQAVNSAKYEYLCAQLGINTARSEIARDVQRVYNLPSAWQLFPGSAETLAALKDQGFKLAIISNWTKNLENIVQGLGIALYFEQITVSTVVCLYKPQTEIFHMTAESLGVKPHQCLHVGDSLKADVRGAKAAGFEAVLFDHTDTNQHEYAPTITTLPELLSLVAS